MTFIKKINVGPSLITLILFCIPFFWLKPGFVNLGGDGGRLYFLEPLELINNTLTVSKAYDVYQFANIPYTFFMYIISLILRTPTLRISFEHGMQLSLSFLGIYMVTKELLISCEKKIDRALDFAAIATGFVYIMFTTRSGWSVALVTLNQVFLNVWIFYLLLKYLLTYRFIYLFGLLVISVIFSTNFGFNSSPQIFSFFPFAFVFLYIYVKYIARKQILWKCLISGLLLFIGLHSFHLLPVIGVLLNKDSIIHALVFGKSNIGNQGVLYFNTIYEDFGVISTELFQTWLQPSIVAILIFVLSFGGFLKKKSKLLALIGFFFVLTLFLVTANITDLGVYLYSRLFYLPGFMMFRSFYDKWHFAFSFYVALTFGVSLCYLLEQKNKRIVISITTIIVGLIFIRLIPFFSGKNVHALINPSKNVSTVFTLDPDLLDAVGYVRTLPVDGKILTTPLSYTYFQIANGEEGGAYIGTSIVGSITGKQDFPGLWSIPLREKLLLSLKNNDTKEILQLFSLLNVRYIFHNSDQRLMHKLPSFFNPDEDNSEGELPREFTSNEGYVSLLSKLPLKQIYEKGFYTLYEIDSSFVRPFIYVPDVIQENNFHSNLYHSAFIDSKLCQFGLCNSTESKIPEITYVKQNNALYDIKITLNEARNPFMVVLSDYFDTGWKLSFPNNPKIVTDHVLVNGYANGWYIDPSAENTPTIQGRMYLAHQNYFYFGLLVSGITFCVVFFLCILEVRKKHVIIA